MSRGITRSNGTVSLLAGFTGRWDRGGWRGGNLGNLVTSSRCVDLSWRSRCRLEEKLWPFLSGTKRRNKRRVSHTVTSRIIPKGGKRARSSPPRAMRLAALPSISCWTSRIRSVEEEVEEVQEGRICREGCCVISAGQWVFWQSKLGLGEFSPFGICEA